jgi:AcrR family transcriptional regulator
MAPAREPARRGTTARRADAERNIATIIATGLDLFSRPGEVSMADVAKAAGLGRVTLYAHFPTRADLLHALVQHAIAQAEHAMDAEPADPGEPADQALTRLLTAAWQVLDRYRRLRAHALTQLGPDQLDRQHDPIRHRLEKIISLGREQHRLRTDLPLDWMVATVFSLVHTAADEIEAGRLSPETAPGLLAATVRGALGAPAGAEAYGPAHPTTRRPVAEPE